MVKNLPAMQETQAWSLGLKDALAKVVATHSSIVVWEIPWTEEPRRLQSLGSPRVWHDWATNIQITPELFTSYSSGCGCVHSHSVTQSYLTLCNSLDCSPPDSSVHHIFQPRILECVAISSSRGSSRSGDQTHISALAGGYFTTEPPGKAQG